MKATATTRKKTMTHKILSIDLETYSDIPIDYGVYRYTDSDQFEILLCGYAFDDEDPVVIDLANGEALPQEFIDALKDPNIEKHAYNASFERVCLSKYLNMFFGAFLSPFDGWWCTQKHAAMMGLPASLADVGKALGLEEQKDQRGKALINYFCKPCKPTHTNGQRTRNFPLHDMEKWEIFKSYNRQDVISERAISHWLDEHYPDAGLEDSKYDYRINECVNDNGVLIDMKMVNNILSYYQDFTEKQSKRAQELTGLDNPNSLAQLKGWLCSRGFTVKSITKDTLPDIVKQAQERGDTTAEEVLRIRTDLSKTSTKKYEAMRDCVCSDGRIHGVMNYYGANRTGRFAARLIQVQNLPRNYLPEIDAVRTLVRNNDWETLEDLYDDIPDLLKQLIRTAIIAPEGKVLSVADFSAIEARVIAWEAGETETQKIFAPGGSQKIYEGTAAAMFGVPIETIAKGRENYALRQRGKVATLACLAEGTQVITSNGLKPIEYITKEDLIWDGENYVRCDGAVYQGEREVISYAGITGTSDHYVLTTDGWRTLSDAAESGSLLVQSKPDRDDIRELGDSLRMQIVLEGLAQTDGSCPVQEMQETVLVKSGKYAEDVINAVQRLCDARNGRKYKVRIPEMARKTSNGTEGTMHKPKGSGIFRIRREGNYIRLQECEGSLPIHYANVPRYRKQKKSSDRQNRQQQRICAGKYKAGVGENKQGESKDNGTIGLSTAILAILNNADNTVSSFWYDSRSGNCYSANSSEDEEKKLAGHKRTARLYDIRNAGINHRYAVSESGIIVHNCGYGGGVGAMRRMDVSHKLDNVSDAEVRDMVKKWRLSHPHIVQWWADLEKACRHVIVYHDEITIGKFRFKHDRNNLFIQMPSGRWITYFNCRIDPNGTEIVYSGTDTNGWSNDLRTYSGKLAENVTQSVARDCLCGAIRHLYEAGYKIIFHVHDEIICEVPNQTDESGNNPYMKNQEKLMTANIGTWDEGIYHPAPGFTSKYYMKD